MKTDGCRSKAVLGAFPSILNPDTLWGNKECIPFAGFINVCWQTDGPHVSFRVHMYEQGKSMLRIMAVALGLLTLMGCVIGDKQYPVDIIDEPLPYQHKLQARQMDQVDMIVIHSTELPILALAREFGERIHYQSGTGNSGHYYIDRDGTIYQYVDDQRIAHHVAGHNERSIGIELINSGRYPDWYTVASQTKKEDYSKAQIHSLITLIQMLSDKYPSIKTLTGHENLDQRLMEASDDPDQSIRRKVDPGLHFPWGQIQQSVSLKVELK